MADLAVSLKGNVEVADYGSNSTTSDDRPSETARAMTRQDELIRLLDDLAGSLEARLSPILGPPSPNALVKQETGPVASPLAVAIEGHTDRIERITSRLYDTLSRIEV
jgi:hypothetical protein